MTAAPTLTSTPGAPATPAVPGGRGRHAKLPHDGTPDFSAALAALLGGNLASSAQAPVAAAEEEGAPAPSSGVTGTQATASDVSVAGTGSLAAALSGARDESVAVSGAAAPFTPATPATPASGRHRGTPDLAHRDTPLPRAEGQVPGTAEAAQPGADTTVEAFTGTPTPTTSLTSTTTAPAPDATVTTTVLRQVFPEVSRVATSPGTHRITITLHPESLGQVTVTVVVRPGGVHVRLAADAGAADGAQARQALLQGAPELHRLLGATSDDVKVVVQGSPQGSTQGQAGQSSPDPQRHSQTQDHAQSQHQSQDQSQPQARSQGDDDRHRASYTPDNPQNLPHTADLPIGATTTTSARSTQPGRVAEHAGRLDRLM